MILFVFLPLQISDTHALPNWMRFLFIKFFPKFLGIKPRNDDEEEEEKGEPVEDTVSKPMPLMGKVFFSLFFLLFSLNVIS